MISCCATEELPPNTLQNCKKFKFWRMTKIRIMVSISRIRLLESNCSGPKKILLSDVHCNNNKNSIQTNLLVQQSASDFLLPFWWLSANPSEKRLQVFARPKETMVGPNIGRPNERRWFRRILKNGKFFINTHLKTHQLINSSPLKCVVITVIICTIFWHKFCLKCNTNLVIFQRKTHLFF